MSDKTMNATVIEPTATTVAETRAQTWRDVVDNPWLMIAMLFLVTAALGLPFLWISRGFSTVSKVVLTILVVAWTVLVLWLFWLVMVWCYGRITDALG
jgi:hypothetical protein